MKYTIQDMHLRSLEGRENTRWNVLKQYHRRKISDTNKTELANILALGYKKKHHKKTMHPQKKQTMNLIQGSRIESGRTARTRPERGTRLRSPRDRGVGSRTAGEGWGARGGAAGTGGPSGSGSWVSHVFQIGGMLKQKA